MKSFMVKILVVVLLASIVNNLYAESFERNRETDSQMDKRLKSWKGHIDSDGIIVNDAYRINNKVVAWYIFPAPLDTLFTSASLFKERKEFIANILNEFCPQIKMLHGYEYEYNYLNKQEEFLYRIRITEKTCIQR